MDVFGIIQLIIPVVTFLMGYFLTDIGYRRNRRLNVIRETFEKLYHPFYMMMLELGTDRDDGLVAIDGDDPAVLKQVIDHLTANAYLATSKGQTLIWETRSIVVSCMAEDNKPDKEKDELLAKSIGALFEHLIEEYMRSATALGYELIPGSLGSTTETR